MLLIIVFLLLVVAVSIMLYQAMLIRRNNQEYDCLHEDYLEVLESAQSLRNTNRTSAKVWQSERQRLWRQARDAEQHGRHMQAFHLDNEAAFKIELARLHALVGLLMMAVPKGGVITHPHEIRRLFRPVVHMTKPVINKQDPLV